MAVIVEKYRRDNHPLVAHYKGKRNPNLIRLMDFHGFTLESLSEASGVSVKAIWCMVHGQSYPRLDTVLCICNTLNCTIDALYPMNYN